MILIVAILFDHTERGLCTPLRTDDEFLIRFLRSRFWKVENAYKLVSIPLAISKRLFSGRKTLPSGSHHFWSIPLYHKKLQHVLLFFGSAMQLLWIPRRKSRTTCRRPSIYVEQTWWRWYRVGDTVPRWRPSPHLDLSLRKLAPIENPNRRYLPGVADIAGDGHDGANFTGGRWHW